MLKLRAFNDQTKRWHWINAPSESDGSLPEGWTISEDSLNANGGNLYMQDGHIYQGLGNISGNWFMIYGSIDAEQGAEIASPGVDKPSLITYDEGYGAIVFKLFSHTEPTDGALNAGECGFWVDQTNGAAKLKIKAKSADGTVVEGEIALV